MRQRLGAGELEGEIVEANQTCAEICGTTQSDLVGKFPWDLYHPDDLERALEPTPVGGMFGSCEIGPVGGVTELLTYSAVLALIDG